MSEMMNWTGVFLLSIMWIYLAVRMGGRAVIRTVIDYRKYFNRKDDENGQEK